MFAVLMLVTYVPIVSPWLPHFRSFETREARSSNAVAPAIGRARPDHSSIHARLQRQAAQARDHSSSNARACASAS